MAGHAVDHDDFGLVELRDSDRLASGGEGAVYSFEPRPDMVAKVCHPSMIDRVRRAKIDHMTAYPPINWDTSGQVFVAWQASLLRVRAGANVNARAHTRIRRSITLHVKTNRKLLPCL